MDALFENFNKGLQSTLVANDPKTGGKQSGEKRIQTPESKFKDGVEIWVSKLDKLGSNAFIKECRRFVYACNDNHVHHTSR